MNRGLRWARAVVALTILALVTPSGDAQTGCLDGYHCAWTLINQDTVISQCVAGSGSHCGDNKCYKLGPGQQSFYMGICVLGGSACNYTDLDVTANWGQTPCAPGLGTICRCSDVYDYFQQTVHMHTCTVS